MNDYFSEATFLSFKNLELELMEGSKLNPSYQENTWFRSQRTDYEKFKLDLVKNVGIYEPDNWQSYDVEEEGGERISLTNLGAYYEIMIYNDPKGIRVNVRPYD
jgi:hypothetical protein